MPHQSTAENHEGATARAAFREFVADMNPREACELPGIQHFAHWLASAANMLIPARYLHEKHDGEMTVREALAAELALGPREPGGSEDTDYWRAIKPHLKALEALFVSRCRCEPAH